MFRAEVATNFFGGGGGGGGGVDGGLDAFNHRGGGGGGRGFSSRVDISCFRDVSFVRSAESQPGWPKMQYPKSSKVWR